MSRNNSEPDTENKSANQQKILQDLDYNAMAFFIKILERKTALVNEMRNFNDLAETNPAALNEKFYQEYGWTGVQINLLDNALKHIAAKFRLRGLNNFNVNQVMQNFDKILSNPLKNFLEMEQKKPGGNPDQDLDQKFFKELKTLLNKNTEQKIEEQIKSLSSKYEAQDMTPKHEESNGHQASNLDFISGNGNSMDIESNKTTNNNNSATSNKEEVEKWKNLIKDDIDENKKTNLNKMVENIIGVLLSLKQNGELNITENKYLTDLCNSIYEENPEEFHEINNVLLNISSK